MESIVEDKFGFLLKGDLESYVRREKNKEQAEMSAGGKHPKDKKKKKIRVSNQ